MHQGQTRISNWLRGNLLKTTHIIRDAQHTQPIENTAHPNAQSVQIINVEEYPSLSTEPRVPVGSNMQDLK